MTSRPLGWQAPARAETAAPHSHRPTRALLRAARSPTLALLLSLALLGCASVRAPDLPPELKALPATPVLLLGEQHDAPEHQSLQARITGALAGRGELAALVMEMAPRGGSTQGLPPTSTDAQVLAALRWDERAWPWSAYGPAAMAAVRAGVPVLGGNLPLEDMRAAMGRTDLEARLPSEALAQQQTLIRQGHCGLLPERQIGPMTRIQIARDLSMAETVAGALSLARPGQRVLLIAGSAHADRAIGVPLHLPPAVGVTALRLQAGHQGLPGERFDAVIHTPPAPAVDHCAGLAEQLKGRSSSSPRP